MTSKGPSSPNCFVILWFIIQVNLPGVATAGDKRQDSFNFKPLHETLSWKCFEFSHPSCHIKLTAPVFLQLTSSSFHLLQDSYLINTNTRLYRMDLCYKPEIIFPLPFWLHCNCEKLSDKICCSMGRGFIHPPTDRNKPTVYSKLSLWLVLFLPHSFYFLTFVTIFKKFKVIDEISSNLLSFVL